MFKLKNYKTLALMLVLASLLPIERVLAADCYDLKWRRGKPYDYYAEETRIHTGTYNGGLLYLVESAHFTDDVRALVAGNTGAQPGDILFVLGSIPNHPGALDSYARYEYLWKTNETFRKRNDTEKPTYDAGCFFQKAASLYPQDAMTYLAWGIYFHRLKAYQESLNKFLIAYKIAPDSAEVNYNTGLAYLDLGNIEKAKEFAARAYQFGHPLDGLKNRIARMEASK